MGNLGLASSAENSVGTQRRVHWILADPTNVEQAFSKVWKKLETAAGSSLVEKSAILSEIIDLIGSEGWSVIEEGGDEQQTRTARQLKRAVEILPDPMTRKEALNLFRNILLTVQSSMMIKNGPKTDDPVALDSPSIMQGSRQREAGSNEDGPLIVTGPAGADGFPGLEPSPTMKASCEEDLSHLQLRPLAGRLHPSLAAESQDIFNCQGPLPPRSDLEAQIRTLRSLAEELGRSNAAEMAVVRELENEVRKAAPSQRLRSARKDDEVVQAQDKLRGHEEIIDEQRQEIEVLQNRRNYEEMESDEKHREAREVAMEIRGWRRSNGSLESEIASEQARSAALRDAFEGRRARYATAEEAARNAEISTMRATRRRIAAEITARREQEAVDEAQQMRSEQSARVAEQCEAISSEIAELRAQALLKGRPQNLDEELKTAEVQLSNEVAEAEDATRELLDLEANISHLEQQTATRESEMYAMQRRRLRQPSLGGSRTPQRQPPRGREEPDPATAADRLALQATEERVAEGRRREQALRDKLQKVASQGAPGARREISDGEDLRERSAEVWAQCRAVATELGEAEAALARRQAEERFSGKEVVDVLKEKLKAALAQEDKNVEELAQVRSETAKHLAAETELQKTGKEEGRGWFPSLIPSWFMGSSEGEPGAVVAA
eukprot:s1114_g8.t1